MSSQINVKPFDRFSIVHAGFGVWAGARGFGLVPVLVMHTAWELLENALKRRYGAAFPFSSPDSVANSIGDTLAMLAGWSLSLGDRLADDPWIGTKNPVRLVWSPPAAPRLPAASAAGTGPRAQARQERRNSS